MNLTKNFTLEEFTKSSIAKNHKIDNTPNDTELFYLQELAYVLQKIRDEYQKPIIISSGFRCEKLNKIVKGAKNSDHRYGAAVDIHSLSDNKTDNKELFDLIVKMATTDQIVLRQIINEYDYDWIHISINNEFNKRKKNEILFIVD